MLKFSPQKQQSVFLADDHKHRIPQPIDTNIHWPLIDFSEATQLYLE